ncbi:MAG TPA: nucleoside hydrolase [Rhodoglobus sp.]|nr:nucleoside hydrolase [Rhodoglobus sp.]HPM51285.1 nucleoside hydrolase [Rhodoglobus sp.]
MSAPSRRIPVAKLTRVIVDNDYAGDPDGLVALAHQLLTESTEVVAITGTTLTPPHDMPGGVPGSAQSAAREVVQWLTPTTEPAVPADTSTPFLELTSIPDASRVILDEAEKSSDLPLFVTCGGPLTNIAAALREDPTLAERMTLCWIGGGAHPEGGWEYNLALDTPAAQFVFNESSAEIHQFPLTTYRQCAFSIAELEFVLSGGGPFGAWLYEKFTNPPTAIRIGDHWPQGDSPVVLTTALGTESSSTRRLPVPWIADDLSYGAHPHPREMILYDRVDTRLLFSDFAARISLLGRG